MTVKFDDDIIATIDKAMGWDDPPEESPSQIAKREGYHCKFIDGPFSSTAWVGRDGVWSVCVLSGIETTLLARSFKEVEKLYRRLRKRQENKKDKMKWKSYYHTMWETRYKKWICKKNSKCDCQLCR